MRAFYLVAHCFPRQSPWRSSAQQATYSRRIPPLAQQNPEKSKVFTASLRDAESSEDALTDQESAESPDEAAVQDYQNRAYPAPYVPFKLTANAQKAWAKIKSQKNKNTAGSWTLAGPSHADFPASTTFSGAAYTSSGRVTALVIDPACSARKCTVWAAAAGGGVWRTDNALSNNGASWTFASGSFATNAIGILTYDAAHN